MITLKELDERREKALEKMGLALGEINRATDTEEIKKQRLLLNESFSELKKTANDRVLFMGGFLK